MDATRFAELRSKLLHDAALPPVWRYFLDEFVDQPGFMERGEPIQHEFLQAVLAQVARQFFPRSTVITDIRLFRLPEFRFIHGGFFIDGRVGGLCYFEEAEIGLIVACEKPPSIDVKYARFRNPPGRPVPVPSVN